MRLRIIRSVSMHYLYVNTASNIMWQCSLDHLNKKMKYKIELLIKPENRVKILTFDFIFWFCTAKKCFSFGGVYIIADC